MNDNLETVRNTIQSFQATTLSRYESNFLKLLREAVKAGEHGNYPVAAAVVNKKNEILSIGTNQYLHPKNVSSAHAEMLAIDQYECEGVANKNECSLFITLEPCLMCTSRIVLSGIPKVLYLLEDPAGGGITFLDNAPDDFRELGTRVTFEKCPVRTELVEIARQLYEIGEALWKRNCKLK